jgi:hypothetical protein
MYPTSRLLGPKLPDFREEENYNLTIRNGLLKVNHFSLNQTEKDVRTTGGGNSNEVQHQGLVEGVVTKGGYNTGCED